MKRALTTLYDLQEAESRLAELDQTLASSGREPAWVSASLLEDREEMAREVATALAGVEVGLLAVYREVQKRTRPAVSQVQDGICGRCYYHLPSELLRRVLAGTGVVRCDHCRRILVWPAAWRLQP
ncbi:MAG: C4-type zinc ribbon domain-containing protein [Bacillota bacterium]